MQAFALERADMLESDYADLETVVRGVMEDHPSVQVAYLFGSAATGHQGPMSDIDIAVLIAESPSRKRREGEIHDALSRALRTDRVDFVALADAPPPLSYRVIREGRCVFCRDPKSREAFETDSVMRYLDFKPLRDQAFRTSRKRILGGV
jgi:predicted nucleotidyltransferase